MIDQALVLDGDPFGLSSGTGCKQDIRQLFRLSADRRRCGNRLPQGGVGQINDVRLMSRQLVDQVSGGDDDLHPRLRQHRRQTLGWIGRIEWQIGRARLEDTQQRNDQLCRAFHTQPDDLLAAHPPRYQMVR